jgi:tRNA A-37 threonylcarbamoyl transferase component Bud32
MAGLIDHIRCFGTGRRSYCHLIKKDGELAVLKEGDRSRFDDPDMYEMVRDVYCLRDKVKHIPVPKRHDFEKQRLISLYYQGFSVPEVLNPNLKGMVLMSFIDGEMLSERSDLETKAPECAYLLGELHKRFETYHGDPNLTNIIINEKITFIDLETDFHDGVTLIHKQARDYRVFLSAVYHRTKETYGSESLFSCINAYCEGASQEHEKKVREYMLYKLGVVRNPKLLNAYDRIGFGNPLHLKELLE